MGFSGIGIWEVLLIIVVALIVLGPSKIPEIARKLGQAVRAIRKASTELTTAVTREVESEKSTASAPETDVSRRDTESSTYPGTVGSQKKEKQPDKPEGQPPQNEQQ
jgi:Tat protein translocase TatB subunit